MGAGGWVKKDSGSQAASSKQEIRKESAKEIENWKLGWRNRAQAWDGTYVYGKGRKAKQDGQRQLAPAAIQPERHEPTCSALLSYRWFPAFEKHTRPAKPVGDKSPARFTAQNEGQNQASSKDSADPGCWERRNKGIVVAANGGLGCRKEKAGRSKKSQVEGAWAAD